MKNIIAILFFVIGFSSLSFSQSPLQVGGLQLNAAFGVNNEEKTPIYAGLDYGFSENITLGGQVGFASDFLSIAGNVNYHFDEVLRLPTEWNVYGGATLGFADIDDNSDLDLGLQAGGRYFFNQNVAINLEVGGGTQVSGGKLGATIIL